ncbi:30S ribosomal protein S6 [Desulfovibrio sp. OttesenSCG-928-I05]|nr:30S ribosomal protein S6 [Desulfovibrio sp. OttesenSCG-928-I05]
MKKYETLLLLSPELAGEARETVLTTLVGIIEREKGVMTATDHWGMRDLAYPVQKQMRGYFVRLEFDAPGALIAELERNIRIMDGIFKFTTVCLDDEKKSVRGSRKKAEPKVEEAV